MADPDAASPAASPAGTPTETLSTAPAGAAASPNEPDLAVVIGSFRPRPETGDELAGVLSRYVVLTRRSPQCRNVDLLVSATDGAVLVVIEKWDSPEAARAHLDAEETVAMARASVPLLAARPSIELFDTISAHDLR